MASRFFVKKLSHSIIYSNSAKYLTIHHTCSMIIVAILTLTTDINVPWGEFPTRTTDQAKMFHPRPLHGVSSPLPVRPSPERSPPKLCENGRAFITDPSTGQNVCLCQLEAHPAHSLQAHPALRGVGRTLPAPRPRFGDLHTSFHHAAQLSAMAPLGEQTNGLLPPHIAFHPYGAMYASMEGAGSPLRRAATRETTGPLKAWLSEHKKNPYPTKAEKIMLAIITRMTLTQVSTWFANARRRLKKDNRLGGSGGEGEADGENDSTVDMDSDREGDSDTTSVDASCCVTPVTPAPVTPTLVTPQVTPTGHHHHHHQHHHVVLGDSRQLLVVGDRDRSHHRDTREDAGEGREEEEEEREEGDGDSRLTSGHCRDDHQQQQQAVALTVDAKLSSEGEVDPDSFSDISDEESSEQHPYLSPVHSAGGAGQRRHSKTRHHHLVSPPAGAISPRSSVVTTTSSSSLVALSTGSGVQSESGVTTSVAGSGERDTSSLSGVDLSRTSSSSSSSLASSSSSSVQSGGVTTGAAEKKPEQQQQVKPKPKIWSISHILDS